MAFGHGKDAALRVTNVAGGTVDLTAYTTSVSMTTSRDEVDVTAMSATYRDWLAGLQDASLETEGIYDPTPDAVLFALGTAASHSFWYYPQGSATGKIVFSGTCVRGDYNIPASVDDAVTYTCAFHIKGSVTRATV